MLFPGRLPVAACALLCAGLCHGAPEVPWGPASDDLRDAVAWVRATGDHGGRPFAVVDKKNARMQVFDANARAVGDAPVLLGSTPGDAPGPPLANRPVASLTASERSTPAGRFESTPGRNDKGEAIVWFDYDAALAIHRLRPAPAAERRAARLASPAPAEHRISFGCIVVPVAFYASVVAPTLGRTAGVVYVLPEHRPTRVFLEGLLLSLRPD